MNFGLTEEQDLLRRAARDFLEKECPTTTVRELMEDARGYQPGIWKQMAELGWLGVLIPEEHGGAGLGMVDLVPILEEAGRALLPSPFFATLQGTLALLRAGDETQKAKLLPSVAAGERILSFAITERAGTENPDDIALVAAKQADSTYRLTGTKLFVPDGQNADTVVVVARTGAAGEAGLSLVLVSRDAAGFEVAPLESVDQTRRMAELRFDGTPGSLLGTENGGFPVWEWVRDRALVMLAADAIGGSERALEASVGHAKERVQFGKPIGVHQAIKHKCADMLVEVESAKAITHYAAWATAEEHEDAPLAAAMAKARASDAYRRVSAENIQIHGGVGFTWEYDCHLYFKRAKALEVTYGDATIHRERVAKLLRV